MRAHVDFAKTGALPPGRLIWQTDPTHFASMLIRLDYADGSQSLVDVDAQMAVRNWDANGGFWVPIDQRDAALTAMDIVIERPHASAVLTRMSISSFADASGQNYARTLLYVYLCGILIMPLVYDLLFFRILRARFMLWHLAMTAATLAFTLVNSGLVVILWPDIPSSARNWSIYLTTSLIMLGSARFLLGILDKDKVPVRIGRALTISALVNLAVALLVGFELEALRMRIADLYFASVLPVIAATAAVIASALTRGSRSASVLAWAYAGLMLVGVAQILAIIGVFGRSDYIDEAIYAGLVVLVTGTSAAVGDRFMVMRAERDRAQVSARKLGAMANSDKLTGLLNRRAFDAHRRLKPGQALLIADIDRFKAINDTYGHPRGDAVLAHAARIIAEAVDSGSGGHIYRLGGEEFAVLAPIDTDEALGSLAETLRAAVERGSASDGGFDMPDITISIGAVLGRGQLMHVAFADADGALYRAKEGGRNRCELAEASVETTA